MDSNKHEQFLEEVFPAELEEIRQRRANAEVDAGNLTDPPSTKNELTGLALSGGGIRSATFSLGVIQGLCKHGLLKHVDILSTVSGGGYIGSCLSALMNNPANKPDAENFPLRYTDTSTEPPSEPLALTHLRNCSNYLAPSGLLTKLRLPNLMLRGILLNLFIFLPFIMALVFVAEIAYEKGPHWDNLHLYFRPLVITFVLMAIAFPFMVRLLRRYFDWESRNAYELVLTIPLLLVGILLLLIPFLHLTRMAIVHSTDQFWTMFSRFGPDDFWKAAIIGSLVIFVFMLAGKASENVHRIAGKLLLLLVGLLGPAIIMAIFLYLCLWQIDSPFLNVSSTSALNQAVECKADAPCLGSESTTEAAAKLQDKMFRLDSLSHFLSDLFEEEKGAKNVPELLHDLNGRTLAIEPGAVVVCKNHFAGDELADEFGSVPCPDPAAGTPWEEDHRVWLIDNAPGSAEPCEGLIDWRDNYFWESVKTPKRCIYISRTSDKSLRIEGPQLHLLDSSEDYWFFSVFVALLLINRFFLDINITSPHGFYRDRLSKAYLFKVDEANNIEPEDNVSLAGLNASGTTAPYHIINVTMNLQGSKDPDLRGRESDFFIFSKLFTGSDRTGYTDSATMESMDHHLDLATAMAISGAAAAPNMGVTTNRALVFIMTLLNVRLGYWLPNPAKVKKGDSWLKRLSFTSAKPTLIIKEAMGWLNAQGSHVNLSDGGHIENLAIYPLLKRQCKFIIAVDGEADPHMAFNGLVTLMRFARIDMGVEIAMDLDGLRKDSRKKKKGLSKVHSTLGKIHYANGEVGELLYIKLSVTGDEPEYIRSYRAHNPEYPHESTADQFFSEAQFEAYRALGEHACEVMLSDPGSIGEFSDFLASSPETNDV
jgi:predicted acylesterase/phospholipase RssA